MENKGTPVDDAQGADIVAVREPRDAARENIPALRSDSSNG